MKVPLKGVVAGSAMMFGVGLLASYEYSQAESEAEKVAAIHVEPLLDQAPELEAKAQAKIAEATADAEEERKIFAESVGQACMSLIENDMSLESIVATIELGGDDCPLRDEQLQFLETSYAMIRPQTASLTAIVDYVNPDGENIQRARNLIEDARLHSAWDYFDRQEHSGIEVVGLNESGDFVSKEIAIERPDMFLFPLSIGAYTLSILGFMGAGGIGIIEWRKKEMAIRRGTNEIVDKLELYLQKDTPENSEGHDDY